MTDKSLAVDIITDPKALSVPCTEIQTLQNNPILDAICTTLVDTFWANVETCVGLAANQIGWNKRVILVRMKHAYVIMINPEMEVSRMFGTMVKKETCLSHPGKITKVKRYKRIKVSYDPYSMEPIDRVTNTYTKMTSRIIQHEMDHLDGILI